MLPLLDTAIPAQADAWSPMSPSAPRLIDGAGDGSTVLERMLNSMQDGYDASTRRVTTELDRLDADSVSTVDMLRLQAHVGAVTVQVEMMKSVADELGRAIQTLTQRS
jgi:hypothetical protein